MKEFFFGMFIGGCMMFILTGILARKERNDLRQDATKAGAAEWVIDPVTGNRKFEWKGVQP